MGVFVDEFTGVVETIGLATDLEIPDSEVPQPRYARMSAAPVVGVTLATGRSLLGLLGTVTGMIEVFDKYSAVTGVDDKVAVFSSGISKALVTTFAGLSPLMLEKSMQAQFLIPMAVSLGFGVIFATPITLVLVPSGYVVLQDLKGLAGRLRRRGDGAAFEVLATNTLNDRFSASPALVGKQLFLRGHKTLYCIAKD